MDIITLAAAKKYTKDSLEGAGAIKGQDGKSAYQIWLDEGNIGSEQDFLNNLKGGPYELLKIESTETSKTLNPNIYYSFDEVETLIIDFAEGTPNKVNEYLFSFISGATATVLTLPSVIKWVNELTVEANKRYEISVVDKVALWCAVDYEVTE